jgi:hypothetical protein
VISELFAGHVPPLRAVHHTIEAEAVCGSRSAGSESEERGYFVYLICDAAAPETLVKEVKFKFPVKSLAGTRESPFQGNQSIKSVVLTGLVPVFLAISQTSQDLQ